MIMPWVIHERRRRRTQLAPLVSKVRDALLNVLSMLSALLAKLSSLPCLCSSAMVAQPDAVHVQPFGEALCRANCLELMVQ